MSLNMIFLQSSTVY